MAQKDYNIVLNKAADLDLNTAHISKQLENYEAARTGFFTMMPMNSDDSVLQLIADKMKEYAGDFSYDPAQIQEALKLNVIKAKIPHFSVETLSYRRGNEVVKFAGVPTFDEGSITVDDIVGIDTKSMLEAWLELAYDLNTRTGGRMYEYKMDWLLTEYTQDYRPVRTWRLVGCFISALSEDDFDKTSDGARQISATIQYDRATMVRGNNTKASSTGVSELDKIKG